LQKYSIENHLISKEALYELIREKNAKLKNLEIDLLFSYDNLLMESKEHLEKLSCCFLINQMYSLGLKHLCIEPQENLI